MPLQRHHAIAPVLLATAWPVTLSTAALLLHPLASWMAGAAFLAASSSIGPAVLAVWLLIRHEWTPGRALLALRIQSAALILMFAAFYLDGGLVGTPAGSPFLDALYFSMVTWTTLGYGDITPIPELRMVAALEALYGYVFFGLIVGLIGARFQR